jgi:carbamoyltransferase
LADPRNKNIKKLINKKIKYREEFRPFCPSVLSKNTNKFYEESFYSPFMNINKRAKKNTKNSYPSIVHSDNTSRIQSVKKIKNQLYFELLSELEKKDNLQNLLNTSLNINEQTMVNHPSEALHTFFCSGLDSLFIENFKIFK